MVGRFVRLVLVAVALAAGLVVVTPQAASAATCLTLQWVERDGSQSYARVQNLCPHTYSFRIHYQDQWGNQYKTSCYSIGFGSARYKFGGTAWVPYYQRLALC